MAVAAASTFMLALVAWLALWGVDTLIPVQGDPGPALIALQTALVMVLVAVVERTVFGMLPLRFLPGGASTPESSRLGRPIRLWDVRIRPHPHQPEEWLSGRCRHDADGDERRPPALLWAWLSHLLGVLPVPEGPRHAKGHAVTCTQEDRK